MRRVLLATLGSLGDLHPLVAIGMELRQRGHAVALCTSESYRQKIEALGFVFHPLRPDIRPEDPATQQLLREIMDPKRGVDRLLRGFIFPQVRAMYDDLFQASQADGGTDLLVSSELVYAAPLLAQKHRIRWASCITAPMSFFSAYDPPVIPVCPRLSIFLHSLGLPANKSVIRVAKFVTRNWSKPVRQLRTELGLPPGPDPIHEGKHSADLVLAMFTPLLAQAQPDWPVPTVITGFPFYDGSNEHTLSPKLAEFLAKGEPPVVFTLGSAAVQNPGSFYVESVKAAVMLKRRAILLMGQNQPPESLPANVAAFDYVPYSMVFPHAAIVVHQGGIGTTGQVLRAGRPALVMPFNFDQQDNARRVTRLGIGRSIARAKYSAPRVAREIKELLENPTYAQNARRVSQSMRDEQGAARAAHALETLLTI